LLAGGGLADSRITDLIATSSALGHDNEQTSQVGHNR